MNKLKIMGLIALLSACGADPSLNVCHQGELSGVYYHQLGSSHGIMSISGCSFVYGIGSCQVSGTFEMSAATSGTMTLAITSVQNCASSPAAATCEFEKLSNGNIDLLCSELGLDQIMVKQ
jgi:hypothetical protein